MTDYVIAPDVSHYQPALSTAYPRDFVIFKMTQGVTYLDSNFLANAGAAHSLHSSGKLAGAVCYHVYSTDSADAQFNKIKAALGPTPPDWLAGVMIDLESWPGTSYAVHGDQSAGVNRLYGLLIAWLGSSRACWLYGNAGDLEGLAPHRDTRAPVILAAYTSELRYHDYVGGLGQQYTNGEATNPVPVIDGKPLPRYTATIGNCDHNVFPGYKNGAALRAWMHPTSGGKDVSATGPEKWDAADWAALTKQLTDNKPLRAAFHDASFGDFNKDVKGKRQQLKTWLSRIRNGQFVGLYDKDGKPVALPPVKG